MKPENDLLFHPLNPTTAVALKSQAMYYKDITHSLLKMRSDSICFFLFV